MTFIRSAALSCLVVLGILAACGIDPPSVDSPDASVTPDASVPAQCDGAGVALCGGACVFTQSNPLHCGGCGQACGSSEVCERGTCTTVCRINGEQVSFGARNPSNPCEQCEPSASATAWTQRVDGSSCGSGQVCSAGACSAKCFIDGKLYNAGTPDPANACEACAPATSTTAWTARESEPLLVGGTDITAQGWTTIAQAPNELTYGPDYVRIATSTNSGGRTSGQLLLLRTKAFDETKPFTLRVTAQVESVSPHNQLDSGAALLGSFTPPYGNSMDRSQMVYLDRAAIGWADDSQSAAFPVTDGAYHVYEFSLDAAKVARVSVDGAVKLTRNNFAANGNIALGDQTNDPNVDGVMRIKSVERLCR